MIFLFAHGCSGGEGGGEIRRICTPSTHQLVVLHQISYSTLMALGKLGLMETLYSILRGVSTAPERKSQIWNFLWAFNWMFAWLKLLRHHHLQGANTKINQRLIQPLFNCGHLENIPSLVHHPHHHHPLSSTYYWHMMLCVFRRRCLQSCSQ